MAIPACRSPLVRRVDPSGSPPDDPSAGAGTRGLAAPFVGRADPTRLYSLTTAPNKR